DLATQTGLCQMLKPFPEEELYDHDAYKQASLQFRFGTASRRHCSVPNWRFLQEEPLRLYFLLQRQKELPLSRILVNIGSGDASFDDPLGPVVSGFASAATPWRGVYFEASPENCRKARENLQTMEGGQVHVRCGFVNPREAADTICKVLDPSGQTACGGRLKGSTSHRAAPRIEVDALSLDIDSYDCAVLREVLQVVSPKMLVLETGAVIPPPLAANAEYHPFFQDSAPAFSDAEEGAGPGVSGAAAMRGETT
ncbi:unnamed protein product, partial [Polarella glacialis]